ncbi:MAG: hypothetical protein KatS3mg076_2149 [Candidatus Binatia bacterium]|nr:MAG: hypothetical protein KatS3mg076_2149 [Candidatus Binatia bacterium]
MKTRASFSGAAAVLRRAWFRTLPIAGALVWLGFFALASFSYAGTVDLVFSIAPNSFNTNTENRLCAGDGLGGFDCADFAPSVSDATDVAVGDVNGDGVSDVVFAVSGAPSRACLGDGAGGFTCGSIGTDAVPSQGVALGFVDGDSHLDAVFAVSGAANRVCLGDGLGGFGCSDAGAGTEDSVAVALGFVDGDANLDAVFANVGGPNTVCLGDGAGGFSCSDVSADVENTSDVALGDVDGDGALDAVFANFFSSARLCKGDGSGAFTCSDLDPLGGAQTGVALGDVDEDGDLDAFFSLTADAGGRLCLGDGSGGFTCTQAGAGGDNADVALGDVDGDGHLDAVFAGSLFATPSDLVPDQNFVCLGDGTGAFRCGPVADETDDANAVALGDLGVDRPLCPPTPAAGCLAPQYSNLRILDGHDDRRSRFLWKWRGPATPVENFGDPVSGITSYVVCLYDETASTPSLLTTLRVPSGGVCGSRACWNARTTGFRYRDRERTPDGVVTMRLSSNPASRFPRSRLFVRGNGENLPLPGAQSPPSYLEQDPKVTVQLRRNDDDFCMEAVLPSPALRNAEVGRGFEFRDKCGTKSTPPC